MSTYREAAKRYEDDLLKEGPEEPTGYLLIPQLYDLAERLDRRPEDNMVAEGLREEWNRLTDRLRYDALQFPTLSDIPHPPPPSNESQHRVFNLSATPTWAILLAVLISIGGFLVSYEKARLLRTKSMIARKEAGLNKDDSNTFTLPTDQDNLVKYILDCLWWDGVLRGELVVFFGFVLLVPYLSIAFFRSANCRSRTASAANNAGNGGNRHRHWPTHPQVETTTET